jgi:hypothetical protein
VELPGSVIVLATADRMSVEVATLFFGFNANSEVSRAPKHSNHYEKNVEFQRMSLGNKGEIGLAT